MSTESFQIAPFHFFRSNNAPLYGEHTYWTADRNFQITRLKRGGWQVYPSYALAAVNKNLALFAIDSGLCSGAFRLRRDAIAALEVFLDSEGLLDS